MSPGKSRFVLLGTAVQESVNGMTKLTGSNGVFAVLSSGMALAVPNSDAPANGRPALTNSGEVHNKRVQAYFEGCGLPHEQVLEVAAHATMHQALDPTQQGPDHSQKPIFDWYSSVITRGVNGIRVADSFAWARFNIDDEVVSEGIYWPPIPQSVVDRAVAFKASASGAAFLAKIPSELAKEKGEVAIHHTPGEGPATPTFYVSYDMVPPIAGGMSRAIHLDENGAVLNVPGEASTASSQVKGP